MQRGEYSAWVSDVLGRLDRYGPEAMDAARFIREHHTRVTVHAQPTGARWTVDRRIEVHPRYAGGSAVDVQAVSLIIHEVRHLQQGALTALSVYGEMEAWQLQFGFIKGRLGRYHAEPGKDELIERLMGEPLGWDRSVLARVRGLMQAYAGPLYRIDLLPLYPLPREVAFRAAHMRPRGIRR